MKEFYWSVLGDFRLVRGWKFPRTLGYFLIVSALALTFSAPVNASTLFTVSPQGPYLSVQDALRDAKDGDTVEVHGGTYHGNIVITKSIALQGVDHPILDADARGTVVMINAPDVIVRGFEIRNSGSEPDQDHAGITVNAPRALVENNQLREVLFGVFIAQAPDSVVRGNEITSQARFEIGRKGDAIRLWYSPRVIVENNHVHDARDVVIWYSQDAHIVNNVIERGRYGIHLMYCDNAAIENNGLFDNSVGIYAMYSKGVVLRANDLRGQRGPSGYALGFKDTNDVVAEQNLIVDNRGGIFLDGTPFSPTGYARFENNVLAFNDIGVTVMPAVKRAEFSNNAFWENTEQMAVNGGGAKLDAIAWRGNFWSDYKGVDVNGDGIGDTPYVAEKFFENMTDREPMLRALIYSPAAQAIEFAASTFPIVKPQPKLQDVAPRVTPAPLPTFAASQNRSGVEMFGAAFALLAGALLIGALAQLRGVKKMEQRISDYHLQDSLQKNFEKKNSSAFAARAAKLGKTYGKTRVLHNVNFELGAGDALALWGANGAGKTTLVKAMLGLVPFDGEMHIGDRSVKRDAKAARRLIGYVPQEVIFYDWNVRATMEFYARLKRVNTARVDALLEQLGLTQHARKTVSALSGGLKQRLALALALLADPPILLLDEPTANLDTDARADYVKTIRDLKRMGKTIVFASHRIEEVEALADVVLRLDVEGEARMLPLDAWRAEIAPAVELTLWLANGERERAHTWLNANGYDAHLNGRGTVVVRARAQEKIRALQMLQAHGFVVNDFEMERATDKG